jgi:hypothetical protein
MRRRVLLVLLVCIALPLSGGCSSEPECIAVPFLPECFEDDDEDKPDDPAPQASVSGHARAAAIDTTIAARRHTLAETDVATLGERPRHLDEIRLNLQGLRYAVVHRDDRFHLRMGGLNRAIRSSLAAIRAEMDRLSG